MGEWARGFVVGFFLAYAFSIALGLALAPLLKTRFRSWIVQDDPWDRDR